MVLSTAVQLLSPIEFTGQSSLVATHVPFHVQYSLLHLQLLFTHPSLVLLAFGHGVPLQVLPDGFHAELTGHIMD